MFGYKLVLNELFYYIEDLNCRGNFVFVMVKNRVFFSLGNYNLYIYIRNLENFRSILCYVNN